MVQEPGTDCHQVEVIQIRHIIEAENTPWTKSCVYEIVRVIYLSECNFKANLSSGRYSGLPSPSSIWMEKLNEKKDYKIL